ncbi:hypothetical protein C8J56DRAFT_142803 [Mycena floridula]|nr:hypothetical protein C8J56DRAFT_142803 [Mycena floridula]
MKFASIFSTLTTLVSFIHFADAAPFVKRARSPLVSHLKAPTTFYRAVTGGEVAVVSQNYVVGKPPATHDNGPGDFATIGALYYVWNNEKAAYAWGNPRCAGQKGSIHPHDIWHLVKLQYTPNPNLKTKTFLTDNGEWKDFVDQCSKEGPGGPPTGFDIVEGPLSCGKGPWRTGWLNDDNNLEWQGAFSGRALNTLKVLSVTPIHMPKDNKRRCCSECTIM